MLSLLRFKLAGLIFLFAVVVYFATGPMADAMQPEAFSYETSVAASAMPPVLFPAGSLIIPMDTGTNGQNNGMLRAYGLVYQLLRNNIPVYWVIEPSKAPFGDDFVIISGSLQDVRTSAALTIPRSYRGGPFIITASDAAAALPFIIAWQATPGDQTAVHRILSGSVTPNAARTLVRAPRIAILKDGNETIAFNNLNAAGITDGVGASWTAASPDLLTEAAVAGPTTTDHTDGVLFHTPGGLARYGYMASIHYNATASTAEVVQETRSWLTANSFTHAFMQCASITVFENDAAAGRFLSTLGLADDGVAATLTTVRVPANPLAQFDGTFQTDSGIVDSIGLAGGSFRAGVMTLINESSSPLLQRIVLLTGNIDGNASLGKVTYFTGHDYALDLPITTNPQTNGVRLFLNSIFESGTATDPGQADVTITKSAPAATNASTIDYTINYSNPGARPVENLKLIDTLPVGTTYVGGSAVPAPASTSGGVLTWNLPSLASGAGGSVTFSVSVTSDGTYNNTARLGFSHLAVRDLSSNTVSTVRDTIAPAVSVIAGPSGPTNAVAPSFQFTTDASAVTRQCAIDNVGYTPCSPSPSQYTSAPLVDGPHTFYVRVTDAAGNTATATRSFEVDSQAPIAVIPVPPNVTVTNDSTPSFVFADIGPSGTAVTFQCRIDSDAFIPCTAPFTSALLVDGPHTFFVNATDAAGNIGSASLNFVVNTSVISGTVTYGNAIGNPVPPRFVKNVSIESTAGSPPVGPVITGTPGTYSLTGFGATSYTIKPTKPGGFNGAITSNDAARVAQGVSSAVPWVSLNQKFAGDASGNGNVTSNDAALIARFAAGLAGTGNVGQWRFFTTDLPGLPTAPLPTPPYNDSRTYASVTSNASGEDYIALLIGEVSGNWNPATHPRPAGKAGSGKRKLESEDGGPERGIEVKLPPVATPVEKEIIIPVSVQGSADKGIISYEFDLRYDPTVIQPLKDPVDVANTVSRGLMVVTNPYEPGLLRVVVYGPMPIDEDGLLLNLRFGAVGAPGSISPLSFERIMFNEGEPLVTVADGRVDLF